LWKNIDITSWRGVSSINFTEVLESKKLTMSETAEKFSVAARDPDPSFGHWSTYLTAESKKDVLQIIHENLSELLECKDFGLAENLPATLNNDYVARLLCVLAYRNDLPILDRILEAGLPIDIRDKTRGRGLTALQISAGFLDQQRMEALLERGANPEIRDREGRAALDHVVTSEKLSSCMEPYFITVLMRRGSLRSDGVRESIQILVERGADLYAQDADGHTAFANAILSLKPEAVKAFLDMADAGEFDLLGSKVSGDLTAKEFCYKHSETLAQTGAPDGSNLFKKGYCGDLFSISYHTHVEIAIRKDKADCDRRVQEIRAQREAGTYVSPFSDNDLL
jgi:hypothetical protein